MSVSQTEPLIPLTLSEQLNAMLAGWMDRHAPERELARPDDVAASVITVAERDVAEVEGFCARWNMAVRRTAGKLGPWLVLVVEGPALHVRGFSEIPAMYRR
jgi:hypothetical protein